LSLSLGKEICGETRKRKEKEERRQRYSTGMSWIFSGEKAKQAGRQAFAVVVVVVFV
jgi:hypothetical protein